MAEALGTASAIATFATLAFQSSVALYQTIQSLHSRDKVIRELREELESLQNVLQALGESMASLDTDLASLEQPLKRCNHACGEFNLLIKRCTPRSTDEKASRIDWLRIRYVGQDISGFKNMLAGYKSTISIALAYANLRTTKTTRLVLEEYKELIENTKCDLENHLDDIRTRIQNTSLQHHSEVPLEDADLRVMEDEKNSTKKSLEICDKFLVLIDQSRPQLLGMDEQSSRMGDYTPSPAALDPHIARSMPFLINSEGLFSTQKELSSWRLKLLKHLIGLDGNVRRQQQRYLPSAESELRPEEESYQEELSGTEALLELCKQAEGEANRQGTHFFEDVSTGNNSRQAIVTTLDDLISAKRIKSGDSSFQALGNMSNESIQCFFRDPELRSNSNGANGENGHTRSSATSTKEPSGNLSEYSSQYIQKAL
ncbi:hypothetical protein N7468_007774 [Penicillium chermesinum]|uniref:Azaphilone pigments biosynthesis cluster protein L N-terminal domain-containing protein n=1 Tax=Penicillium chermesinum TaxID=63820 RepID=A0A9W9THP2_9EURO|nr:uncharacterized protein N7468_007774 [Penicillium chermesinum]KAJ5223232.1 hypothetical protein N7468_007774 [Penicillium chermesinum]